MSKNRAKTPSQRQLRVGELLRHAVSQTLSRGNIQDPVLDGAVITVVEVAASPDLRNATAYVMPLGGINQDQIIEALGRNASYIRGQVSRLVDLKYMPQIEFRIDPSFDQSDRIDTLLKDPKVARDVGGEH